MKQIMTKDDKAVSPIIATILLIAITVVLAATLVTILGGFTHGASGTAATANVPTQLATSSSTGTSVFANVTAFSATNVSSSKISVTLTVTAGGKTFTYTGNLGSTSLANASSSTTNTFTQKTPPAFFTAGTDYVFTDAALQSATSITLQLTYSGSVIWSSGTVT